MRRRRSAPGRRPERGYVLIGVVLTLMMAAAIAYQIGRESAQNVTGAGAEAQTVQARYVAEAGLAYAAAQLNAAGTCATIAAGAPVTGQIGADSFSVSSTTVTANPLTLTLTSTPTLAATGATYAPLSKTVTIYTRAEQQTTLYRTWAGVVADSTIAYKRPGVANATTFNYGADPLLTIDNSPNVANALLRFDLGGALPAGAKLKTAQLVLTPMVPGPTTATPATSRSTRSRGRGRRAPALRRPCDRDERRDLEPAPVGRAELGFRAVPRADHGNKVPATGPAAPTTGGGDTTRRTSRAPTPSRARCPPVTPGT